jgi:DNA-binding CsgD family transcriptional regulator
MPQLLVASGIGGSGGKRNPAREGERARHPPRGQPCDGALRSGLLERDGELTRIEQAVADLRRGRGGVLVIQGAAGIGKSALLTVVCEHAAGHGMVSLTARANELEGEFGFGVVRQLLERHVMGADAEQRAGLLAGAARLAAPVLGLGGSVDDPFAALHGLYWLLANLSLGGPVVVAVDDLQWADEPSLRWLVYLCRRLEDLPVLVAASTHPPRPGHSSLLAELLALSGVQILCLNPLSEPAVSQLLCEGLGAQPHPVFVAACTQATGGNPFVLHELILDLATNGVAPSADQAPNVAERVPARVERAVLARLSRLDHEAVRLAQAVTILGERTELRLAAALADLKINVAAEAADALVTAELLAAGRPLRFVHPLVRSAIYEQIPSGARSQAHARAAHLLATEGVEPEQVAVQLLVCDPASDPDTVNALRAAQAAALRRGVPETAIRYLRRALTEPPAEQVRAAVLGELGGAEKIARDPTAVVHLRQAWQATPDPVIRAQLASKLADVFMAAGQWNRWLAMLQAGLDDLEDHDPDLAVQLYARKAYGQSWITRPTETSDVAVDQLRELAGRDVPARRFAQLLLANLLSAQGERCGRVVELVESGWDGGRYLAEATAEMQTAPSAGVWTLINVDELDRADAFVEAMLADAQRRGWVLGFADATALRGLIGLRRGRLADADADTRVALELVTQHHLPPRIAVFTAYLSLTLLERGELDQAAALVEPGMTDAAIVGVAFSALLLETRGRVRLARGQREQAIVDLRQCGQLADHIRWHNPNYSAWRSALALALAPDDPQEARELAQAELQLAHRTGSSRAIGVALRVCGLLAGTEDSIKLLEHSAAALENTPMQLELAHSLTEWGAALRRAGARTAARDPLRRALDLAARCGATPLAQRARDEALAAGARPRRPWTSGVHALTPSELRVARLAAQGMSNRDIAQALFITTKTVSDHLTSAYRKLNISSRDQLAAAMK